MKQPDIETATLNRSGWQTAGLLNGLDSIGLTLQHEAAIAAY